MKILIIQQRYGIGDLIIFLPYIQAISKKFNTKLSSKKVFLMNFGYFFYRKVLIQCSRLGHYSGWDIIQDWDIIQIVTVFGF